MEKVKQKGKPPKLLVSPSLKKSISDQKEKTKKPIRKLIFLAGFANTGKDTFVKFLQEISIEPVVRVAFADALKREVYPTLGREYSGVESEDREWKDKHRAEIIAYGEGQKHKHGQNYWVKQALDPLLLKEYRREIDIPHIVVTDCRRVEEIMWYKHFKLDHFEELKKARKIYEPIMYVVHRKGAESDSDYLTHIALEYATETRAFFLVKNYGSEKDFKKLIDHLYVREIR